MVPAITAGGRSFRGAFLYYAHDKRRDGEAVRFTTERVAWVETVNLPTGDPKRAWKVMAHTALAQAELKAAAGTKATGRKLKNPVFAYSIAWHPGERPTKAQMMEAARASLEAQGLEEHQAIIFRHTDEPQAHVHIVANRVHPVTGKAATLSNSKLKLSQWAEAYERERGKVFCPQRVSNNARRSRGEFVRHPRTPRPMFEFNQATANDQLRRTFAATGQRQQDAHLHEIGRTMRRSHAASGANCARSTATAIQANSARFFSNSATRCATRKRGSGKSCGRLGKPATPSAAPPSLLSPTARPPGKLDALTGRD
jgi:relaxase-like protein